MQRNAALIARYRARAAGITTRDLRTRKVTVQYVNRFASLLRKTHDGLLVHFYIWALALYKHLTLL